VDRYQKGKTNLDFTEARDSEWQWHPLGRMQVCTSLQTDNHASTPPLRFFTGRMTFLPPNQQRQSTEDTVLQCAVACKQLLLFSVAWSSIVTCTVLTAFLVIDCYLYGSDCTAGRRLLPVQFRLRSWSLIVTCIVVIALQVKEDDANTAENTSADQG